MPYIESLPILQLYSVDEIERIRSRIIVYLNDIELVGNALTTNWYTGKYSLNWITIYTKHIAAIHANAFNGPAFRDLTHLAVHVSHGSLNIRPGAFICSSVMLSIEFRIREVQNLPAGIFDPVAISIWSIIFEPWPNDVNLNDMFANEAYRMLKVLFIYDVQLPQTKFYRLAAANFSAFRRLQLLELVNCGIEVIETDTFTAIGQTLSWIKLEGNWLKAIAIDMFRPFFETKIWGTFSLLHNRIPLPCTCQLIEMDVMQCPFRHTTDLCLECWARHGFSATACGIYREVAFQKLCVKFDIEPIFMRIVDVRMTLENHSMWIGTNFTSGIRLLIVNLGAMYANGKCNARVTNANFKCLLVNKSESYLGLRQLSEFRDAEYISITAIPILHGFGAKPLHSWTLRQAFATNHWLCDYWILIATILIVFDVAVGFGFGICTECIGKYWQTDATTVTATLASTSERRPSYYYVGPIFVIDDDQKRVNNDEYIECDAGSNYEHEDGYLQLC